MASSKADRNRRPSPRLRAKGGMLAVLKTLVRGLVKRLFRVEVRGLENYPCREARLLIVANHVSFLDGVLLSAFLPEIPVFVINTHMARHWWVRPFIWLTRHITIDPANPLYLKVLIQHLKEGERVAIFPEGRITVTGALMKVYEGPALAADKADAVILPVHIAGAQYSLLSRLKGKVRRRPFPRIRLTVLPPRRLVLPKDLIGRKRRYRLGRLLDDLMMELSHVGMPSDRPFFAALLEARAVHGGGHRLVRDIQQPWLSYSQLMTRSWVLSGLLERDSADQRYVGIMLPNSVAVLTTLLALQLRNRVPVILNSNWEGQKLLAACRTAGVATIYTSRTFIETGKRQEAVTHLEREFKIVFLEELYAQAALSDRLRGWWQGLFSGYAYGRLAGPVRGDDAAVVLFSPSGEDKPKAVVLSHRNLLANCAQVSAILDIFPNDLVLNTVPLCHAVGLSTGVLLPLLTGSKMVFCPLSLHYHLIPELAYEQCATVLLGADALLLGSARDAHPYDFFSVRRVIGLGPLQEETRRLWRDRFGIRILASYGMTEASGLLAVNTFRHFRSGTVGRLVPGIDYYLEPVEDNPGGGRLCVRGANIMIGYLSGEHSSELQSPATPQGEGWYDTGDIVCIDEDGFVAIQEHTGSTT